MFMCGFGGEVSYHRDDIAKQLEAVFDAIMAGFEQYYGCGCDRYDEPDKGDTDDKIDDYELGEAGPSIDYDYDGIVKALASKLEMYGPCILNNRAAIDKIVKENTYTDFSGIYPCPECRKYSLSIVDASDGANYIICRHCGFSGDRVAPGSTHPEVWSKFHDFLVREGYLNK